MALGRFTLEIPLRIQLLFGLNIELPSIIEFIDTVAAMYDHHRVELSDETSSQNLEGYQVLIQGYLIM